MKKAILAVAIAVASWPFGAGAQAPARFADIPWGSPKTETRQKLEALGFTFQEEDRGGDLEFAGAIPALNEKGAISAVFTPGNKLVKVRANVTVSDRRAIDAYRAYKQSLVEAYGPPFRDIEQYAYPYDKPGRAAGHEISAIKGGKARFLALWSGLADGNVALAMTNKLVIQIDYEGPGWPPELARRQAIPGWDPCCD